MQKNIVFLETFFVPFCVFLLHKMEHIFLDIVNRKKRSKILEKKRILEYDRYIKNEEAKK